jgi:hypothetical protein
MQMMFAIFWSKTLRGVFAGAAALPFALGFVALVGAFWRVLTVVSGITRIPSVNVE